MSVMTFWDFCPIPVSQRGFPHICVHISVELMMNRFW